jgi:small-conductance mechanosensitive channel
MYLQRQIENLDRLFQTQLTSQGKMLDERYATQTKALDAAFVSQQTATATAFGAADKAVQAALLAAEKAVVKAENASEKRFENVNEFRGQLADIQGTLISRVEADARFNDLGRQVSEIKSTIDKGFTAVDTRTSAGKDSWGYLVGAIGMIAVIVTLALTLAGK